ncbi:MAG: hypothetical protein JWO30_3184 [Fibrobacteres bacterium]|nr:hypothetical protein [Fibrobacterota bacterium]
MKARSLSGVLAFALVSAFPSSARKDSKISAGETFALAIAGAGGTVSGFGNNFVHQLGLGHTTYQATPQIILEGCRHVSGGYYFGFALKNDSTLWSWGYNGAGTLGSGGAGDNPTPARVGGAKWIHVAGKFRAYHAMGIQADSSLWAWGDNGNGTLGDGTTTQRSAPVKIGTAKWLDVRLGTGHTLAIKSDSTLWAWGVGWDGRLGTGGTSNVISPVQIGSQKWLMADGGGEDEDYASSFSVGIKADSTLWVWGANTIYQLGLGDDTQRNSPVQSGSSKWISVSVGDEITLAIRSDSTLWEWGHNYYGALGMGDTTDAPTPVQIGVLKWKEIYAGVNNAYGVTSTGAYYSWGQGGLTGTVDNSSRTSPGTFSPARTIVGQTITFGALAAKVSGSSDFSPGATASSGLAVTYGSSNTAVATVSGGLLHIVGVGTAAIIASQSGDADYSTALDVTQTLTVGKGDQTLTFASLPAKTWLDADFDPSATASSGLTVSYASSDTTVATLVSSQIHLVGAGTATITASQGGDGNYNAATNATQTLIVTHPPHPHRDRKVAGMISGALLIRDGIGLFGTGFNEAFELGLGNDSANRNSFHLIQPGNWRHVDGGGEYAFALKEDSTLWGWGTQWDGFGDDSTQHHTPTQIGTRRWITVVAGINATSNYGIQSDSTLWAWGSNSQMNYGDGTSTSQSAPTQIGTDKWVDISFSQEHALGIKADRTLWSWGSDEYGILGHGNVGQVLPVPVKIGSSTWSMVAAGASSSLAIRSDSTLWAWGLGAAGTGLGLGVVNVLVPTQVGGVSSKWIKVEVGGGFSTLALKADSTFWSFGSNSAGYIAQGASSDAGFPTQVGTGKWREVALGASSGIGQTAAGDFYAWGNNTNGAVGDSTNTTRTTPVSVKFNRTQTFTFPAIADKSVGDADFAPGASSNSGFAVTYTSSDPAVATIVSGQIHIVGPGTTTITASAGGNVVYDAGEATQTLAVGKTAQTITFAALSAKTFGDADFALSDSTSSGLGVSYASSNTAVATVSGLTVHILGAGSTTITASQAGNSSYDSAVSIPQTLVVGKKSQTLTFAAFSAKTYGDSDVVLPDTSSAGLGVAYESSDTSVATVSGHIMHIVRAGATAITARQPGNANFDSAASLARTLNVGRKSQTITFNALPSKNFGAAHFALDASASSTLGITYASSNSAVAAISGDSVHIVGAGSADITASQAGSSNYDSAASISRTLSVGKQAQTLSFSPLSNRVFGDADFSLVASASSGLGIVFVSANPAVATISGTTVHIVGPGSTTITASQAGNADYDAASDTAQILTIGIHGQTITFAALPSKTYGDADFTPGATAESGLPVSYASSDTAVASIVSGQIHIKGAGTVTITAGQAGNSFYGAAPDLGRALTVAKAAQTIAFAALPAKTFGDADFVLSATAGSGLPVSYVSADTSVAVIAGGQIHIVGAGSTQITASQAGNTAFNPAPDVAQTLTVARAGQTLTLSALTPKTFGDSDFILGATASSGLIPVFAIADTQVAQIVSGKVHLLGEGSTAITWAQTGNANFEAAPVAVETLTVGRASQSLVFELGADSLKTPGDPAFTLTAVSSSGLPVAFSSSDSAIISLNGNEAEILKAGTAAITAVQAGNPQFAPAATVTRKIRVRPAIPLPFLASEMRPVAQAIVDTSVGFFWPLRTGATAYHVQVSRDTAGATFLADSQVTDTSFTLRGLSFGATISWRISALNASGASAFSPFLSLQVRPLPPAPLDIARIPTFPAAGVGRQVEIAWPKVDGSTGYHVQVSLDITLPPIVDTLVANPTLTLTDLPAGSTQNWRVAPVNGVSEAPFTPWISFKVRDQEDGAVTRSAVVDSAKPEPVQVSVLVGLESKDRALSDIRITLTEEKKAPANLPKGFLPLTGRIELEAKAGSIVVGDNQVSITLTAPDTLLNGDKLASGEVPMVYLLDSATGELTVLYDLKKDSLGRIILPLSKGKSFLLAVDTVPPVIADATPPEIRETGSTPVISGTVSDNIRNSRAWLRYRQGGSETFDSVAVTVDASGHFEMPLALKLDSSGFEYNVVASDGRNRRTTTSIDLPVTMKALQSLDSLPSLQWRLFALPTIANENQWSDMTATLGVYGQDWRLFERAPEGMKEFGPQLKKAEPGVAYWLKSRSRGFRPAITGGIAAPISKPFVIALPPRSWRSFGNPFLFPVSWQSVVDSSRAAPGALVGPYTFRDSSWVAPLEVPVLAPWEGYYAFNPTSDTVYLRIPSIRAKNNPGLLAKAAFHLRWQVRGVEGKDAGNVFGGLPVQGPAVQGSVAAKVAAAPNAAMQWNAAKPENPDGGLRAGFVAVEEGSGLLQTDFRDVSAQGGAMWTARLDGMKPGHRYSSRFLGLESLSEGVSVALADPATGSFVPWSADAAYTVEAQAGETARELQFFAGSPEYVASRGLAFAAAHPSAIELTNYPNPFQSYTVLRFAVPVSASAQSRVKLSVLDMQGRCIKVLADARMGAGRHSMRWDARDEKGGRVAAGMYRLLLQVGDKRMNRALHITH